MNMNMNIPNNVLNDTIYCCLSSDKSKHFVEQPLKLSCCGRYICKNCCTMSTSSSSQEHEFSCYYCKCGSKVNESSCSLLTNISENESIFINNLFQEYLNDFYKLLQNEFKIKLQLINDECSECERRIDLKINYVKEEIEIRVESIKIELDLLNDELQNQLENERIRIKDLLENEINCERQVCAINELQEHIKNDLDTENFYAFQKQIKDLELFLEKINEFKFQIDFEPSDYGLCRDFIGTLKVNRFVPWKKSATQNTVTLDVIPISLLVTSDNRLIMTTTRQQILIFDSQLNLLRTIERINNQIISPYGIASSKNGEFYICDARNSRIIQTDSEFNYIKDFGKKGNKENQLNNPYDIAVYRNWIFVCDSMNKRIQKLSSSLAYDSSFKLDDYPLEIRIYRDTMCIRNYSGTLHFYNLPTLEIITKRDEFNDCICTFNSYFYSYCHTKNRIICFDSNGILVKEDELKFDDTSLKTINCIAFFNKQLVLSIDRKLIFT